jgi:hypothetical protein
MGVIIEYTKVIKDEPVSHENFGVCSICHKIPPEPPDISSAEAGVLQYTAATLD